MDQIKYLSGDKIIEPFVDCNSNYNLQNNDEQSLTVSFLICNILSAIHCRIYIIYIVLQL